MVLQLCAGCSKGADSRGQLREHLMLDRYISQTPHEDGGLYGRLIRLIEHPFDDIGCPYVAASCELMEKKMSQLEERIMEIDASVICPYSFAGCTFTSSSKSSRLSHIHSEHLQPEYYTCATQGGYCQKSNVLHHTNESAAIFTNQSRLSPTNMQYSGSECEVDFALERWLDGFHIIDDNRLNIDRPKMQLFLPPESPEPSSKSSSVDGSYINDSISTTYTCSSSSDPDPDHSANQAPSCPIFTPVPYLFDLQSYISGYSSSPLSMVMEEVFSLKSSPNTNADSALMLQDHDGTVPQNSEAEQVSRSDLVNEFVHFTMSWFVTWYANHLNDTNNQETQCRTGGDNGQSYRENKRKRSTTKYDTARSGKIRRTDKTNEDDPGDGSGETPNTTNHQPNLERGLLFACPLFQRDPTNYGHGRWKICAHSGWNSYHRVREHVYRKHTRPIFFCERCFEDFKDAQSLQQHYGQPQCEEKNVCPYIDSDQVTQIKEIAMRGMPGTEKWKRMYTIIFPGDENIPSPYKSELCYNTDVEVALSSEIERILRSSSLDSNLQQTIRQIIRVTIQTILNTNMAVVGEQYNPRVENTIDTGAVAAVHGFIENTMAGNVLNQDYQTFEPDRAADTFSFIDSAGDYREAANDFLRDSFEDFLANTLDFSQCEETFGNGSR